ncbi:MAG: hypothetical protein HRT69_15765 [Flavobacteriaceae bacterium]|nr:hypothetical protein [Flavobacteriaceae bacterium]
MRQGNNENTKSITPSQSLMNDFYALENNKKNIPKRQYLTQLSAYQLNVKAMLGKPLDDLLTPQELAAYDNLTNTILA